MFVVLEACWPLSVSICLVSSRALAWNIPLGIVANGAALETLLPMLSQWGMAKTLRISVVCSRGLKLRFHGRNRTRMMLLFAKISPIIWKNAFSSWQNGFRSWVFVLRFRLRLLPILTISVNACWQNNALHATGKHVRTVIRLRLMDGSIWIFGGWRSNHVCGWLKGVIALPGGSMSDSFISRDMNAEQMSFPRSSACLSVVRWCIIA